MERLNPPQFDVELIDFRQKRLNLDHNPRTESSIKVKSSFNAFGRALVKLRKSFIPEQIQTK